MWPYMFAYPSLVANREGESSGSKYLKNEEKFLSLLHQAIRDEREAQQYYAQLLRFAHTPFEREMIQHPLRDERKHEQMLLQVYRQLTGKEATLSAPSGGEVREFIEGLKKAFQDELAAQEMYREMILLVHPEAQWLRDYLFIIWSDEVEHAQRFTFLRAERS